MPKIKNENKIIKKSNSHLILIIVVLTIFISGTFSYFYVKNTIDNNNNDINTSFNIKGDIEVIEKGVRTGFGEFSLLNGGIMLFDNGLKQKLSFGEFAGKSDFDNEKLDFQMRNLDIISDNEKVFISLGEGIEKLSELLVYTKYNGLIDDLKENLDKGDYIMIDNSKPILKILGELSKNELIKELVIGASTSNPSQYYLEHGVNEEFNKFLSNDKILDYLFVEGDRDESSSKVRLSLNTSICNDFGPVIVNLGNSFQETIPVNMDNVSSEDIINECITGINNTNNVISFLVQIYKEGDIDNGNFAFSITAGNILDIKLNYLNHIIDNGYLSLEAPDKSLSLNVNFDKKEANTSNLKIAYDNSGLKVSGEIINGEGNINISGKEEGMYELLGDINISSYFVSDYDITGKVEGGDGEESTFLAKGDFIKGGDINYLINDNGDFYKMDFNYSIIDKSYSLEYNGDYLAFISSYKDKMLSLKSYGKDSEGNKKGELDIIIDNGKLKGFIKDEQDIDMVLEGDFTSIKNLSLIIEEKIEDFKVEFKSNLKSLSELEFSLLLLEQGKEVSKSILTIEISKKDGFNIMNFNLNIKGSDKFSFISNLNIEAKHGGVEYKLPEKYKEIDVNVSELIILPNTINTDKLYEDKKLIIGGVTAGAVLGTIGFISLQGYSADARNSKRTSDMGSIISLITIETTKGVAIESLVTRDERYEGKEITIGGEKLIAGKNYFVGIPNYLALRIKKEDFSDPDGTDYIIGVTTIDGGKYQVLSFLENSSYKEATIRGNYLSNISDTEGLIFINGLVQTNN